MMDFVKPPEEPVMVTCHLPLATCQTKMARSNKTNKIIHFIGPFSIAGALMDAYMGIQFFSKPLSDVGLFDSFQFEYTGQ
ncbi:MAG: hypothetical protein ACXWTS_11135 [Methylococcaceae bacterium]